MVRLTHQISNLQIPLAFKTLIAAISTPELAAFREALIHLGQVLGLTAASPAPAVVGGVVGALAASLLQPSSNAEVPAAPVQQPASPAGIASGTLPFSSLAAAARSCGSGISGNSAGSGSAPSAQPSSNSSSSNHSGRVPAPQSFHSSSSSSSPRAARPAPPDTPYKDAVQSEVVTVPFTSPLQVTGGVQGRKFGVVIDIGCTYSIMSQPWLRRNKNLFFFPGSPVQLLAFEQPGPSLGVLLGDMRSDATYMLRNVPLELGDGVYWVNFLVMPHSAFEVALGLEFVDTYAVRVSTKAYGVPSSGPQLYIPTPRSFCSRSMQESWPAGVTFYHNKVKGHFSISKQRYHAVQVAPSVLSA
jgi:hypothetical protein